MTLLHLLALLIVVCLFFWALRYLAAVFALPPQVVGVIYVVAVVVLVLFLLQLFGLLPARLRLS